ncbi:hypothetical protein OIO90_004591 [Microbotryomycetes sp. JL221]|nr:hypothetical protein OIO90_004591 [Microbotryomycetes sp. JL221]
MNGDTSSDDIVFVEPATARQSKHESTLSKDTVSRGHRGSTKPDDDMHEAPASRQTLKLTHKASVVDDEEQIVHQHGTQPYSNTIKIKLASDQILLSSSSVTELDQAEAARHKSVSTHVLAASESMPEFEAGGDRMLSQLDEGARSSSAPTSTSKTNPRTRGMLAPTDHRHGTTQANARKQGVPTISKKSIQKGGSDDDLDDFFTRKKSTFTKRRPGANSASALAANKVKSEPLLNNNRRRLPATQKRVISSSSSSSASSSKSSGSDTDDVVIDNGREAIATAVRPIKLPAWARRKDAKLVKNQTSCTGGNRRKRRMSVDTDEEAEAEKIRLKEKEDKNRAKGKKKVADEDQDFDSETETDDAMEDTAVLKSTESRVISSDSDEEPVKTTNSRTANRARRSPIRRQRTQSPTSNHDKSRQPLTPAVMTRSARRAASILDSSPSKTETTAAAPVDLLDGFESDTPLDPEMERIRRAVLGSNTQAASSDSVVVDDEGSGRTTGSAVAAAQLALQDDVYVSVSFTMDPDINASDAARRAYERPMFFNVASREPFEGLFNKLATVRTIPPDKIILRYENRSILPFGTPDSLGMFGQVKIEAYDSLVWDKLEQHRRQRLVYVPTGDDMGTGHDDSDEIVVTGGDDFERRDDITLTAYPQIDQSRGGIVAPGSPFGDSDLFRITLRGPGNKSLPLAVKRRTLLSVLLKQYVKKFDIDEATAMRLKLEFDGERLDLTKRIEDYEDDVEDDSVVDVLELRA